MLPVRRAEGLIVQEVAEETVVYDQKGHRAHCLNKTAALVWRHQGPPQRRHSRSLRRILRLQRSVAFLNLQADRGRGFQHNRQHEKLRDDAERSMSVTLSSCTHSASILGASSALSAE